MKNTYKKIWFLCALLLLTACHNHSQLPNHLYQYLEGAELQYETIENKEEIRHVLNDMLHLSSDELKRKKYKNYRGITEWPAHYVIERYFVPNSQKFLDKDTFYEELAEPKTKKSIHKWLEEVEAIS